MSVLSHYSSFYTKSVCFQLGIDKVFTEHADLSDITPDNNLQVNTVIQKTFINVTETGTEAAAATASKLTA